MKTAPRVRLIYFDPRTDGGKVGFDDFFAAGGTLTTLLARATEQLKPVPDHEHEFPYKDTPYGLVWLKPTRDGAIATPLCNFTARIVVDRVEDDGIETRRMFAVEARQGNRVATVTVSAERFAAMNWPTDALGAQAILAPGQGVRDHTRVAIQCLSQPVQEHRVYTYLGWRKVGEHWVYLHAGGAIGAAGAVESLAVSVPAALERYVLPTLPEEKEPTEAIRASLRMLDVAPYAISVPCLAATYRAALGAIDFSVHAAGPTGAGKSELAALVQQHYGAGLDARHLPASWSSTGNSLEGLAFVAKDAVMVVDDFCPTGSSNDIQRSHREADRLLRAQGNAARRQRMRADTTLRPVKPPRGLIFSTGEDVPRGQSLRARLWTLELAPDAMNWTQLSTCQEEAVAGLYAQAFAAFARWLAPQYEEIRAKLANEIRVLQAHAEQGMHRRTPTILANLALGLFYFLRFAREADALTGAEADRLWILAWDALSEGADAQAEHQVSSDPARRFITLLSSALASGRAHIASPSGSASVDAKSWGWRLNGEQASWTAKGERIGWIDEENLYLEPDAAYAVAQKLARDQTESIPITPRTLHKRLREGGYLASSQDSSRTTIQIRRTLEGQRREVLHLRKSIFSESLSPHKKHDQHDHSANGYANGANGQVFSTPWSGYFSEPDHETDHRN